MAFNLMFSNPRFLPGFVRGQRRVVLVIAPELAAAEALRSLLEKHRLFLEIRFLLVPRKQKKLKYCGIHLNSLAEFKAILGKNQVDAVFVVDNNNKLLSKHSEIVSACEVFGKQLYLEQPWTKAIFSNSRLEHLGNKAFYVLDPLKISRGYLFVKRFFDIFFASCAIILLLPVWIIVPILIKVTSTGSVFFIDKRAGLNNSRINVYKFRTMYTNALSEKKTAGHVLYKNPRDARVVPFGRFLRKYSLDEFPQFFNVLFGSMSIVGPRPLSLADFALTEDWHKFSLGIKPGLTCYWQIRGRNKLSWLGDKALFDIEYISRASLLEDLIIIFKTIFVILRGSGM